MPPSIGEASCAMKLHLGKADLFMLSYAIDVK